MKSCPVLLKYRSTKNEGHLKNKKHENICSLRQNTYRAVAIVAHNLYKYCTIMTATEEIVKLEDQLLACIFRCINTVLKNCAIGSVKGTKIRNCQIKYEIQENL